MALFDLSADDVANFVTFLISKGANVNTADLKGDTPLHLLANYTSKLSHEESRIKENVEREDENLIAVIKLLLANGANLSAKNNNEQTPFSIALNGSRIKILDLLSDSVKISKNVQLLHDFKNFIFDERYLSILYKLLKRDEGLMSAADFNLLDNTGFSVFLAYIRSWTQNYSSIYSKVQRECVYQYRIHKRDYSKYSFTQKEINDQFRNDYMDMHHPDPTIHNYGSLDTFTGAFDVKTQKKIVRKFIISLYEEPFVNLLKYLVSHGADPKAKVDKLAYYRRLEEQRQKILRDENLLAEEVKQQAEQDVVMIDTSANQPSQTNGVAQKKPQGDTVRTR